VKNCKLTLPEVSHREVFVVSYEHLGFTLHDLLFNECPLYYFSAMSCLLPCMRVFCVCVNDICNSACGKATCDELLMILHVASSFNTCIIMVVVSKTYKIDLVAVCVVGFSALKLQFSCL